MTIRISVKAATSKHLSAILDLQETSLKENLNEKDAANHGFLRTRVPESDFLQFIEHGWVFVAETHGAVVGYSVGGEWDYFKRWKIFRLIINRIPSITYRGKTISLEKSFQYGPICVRPGYQGHGVSQELFNSAMKRFGNSHEVGITFVNSQNGRSLAAHTKFGMSIVDEFKCDGEKFFLLAYLLD